MALDVEVELQPILTPQKEDGYTVPPIPATENVRKPVVKPAARIVIKATSLIGLWYLSNPGSYYLCSLFATSAASSQRACGWSFACQAINLYSFGQAMALSCRYFLSTLLSMWNKRLLDRDHGGVLDMGPFPGETELSLSASLRSDCCMYLINDVELGKGLWQAKGVICINSGPLMSPEAPRLLLMYKLLPAPEMCFEFFAAPLLMSSLQFGGQIVLADVVLRSGLAKRRYKDVMPWRKFVRQGNLLTFGIREANYISPHGAY